MGTLPLLILASKHWNFLTFIWYWLTDTFGARFGFTALQVARNCLSLKTEKHNQTTTEHNYQNTTTLHLTQKHHYNAKKTKKNNHKDSIHTTTTKLQNISAKTTTA